MTARTSALVKELAQLFVRYRLADWEPVIKELEAGDRSSLAQAVGQLAMAAQLKAPRKSGGAKKKRQTKSPAPAPLDLRPERAEALTRIHNDLTAKKMLPAVGDIRTAFLALGIKGSPRPTRADTVRVVIEHLNTVEDARFDGAVNTLLRDATRNKSGTDYQRWFDLIGSKRPADSPVE